MRRQACRSGLRALRASAAAPAPCPAAAGANASRQLSSTSADGGAAAEQPPEPELLIANAPGMRIVDFNRPRALNSLNGQMVRTLLPLVQDWQQPNGDVHLVVLRGSEPRAFCAGGDIRFLHDCAAIGEGPPLAAAHAFFYDEYTLNHALGTSRIPIVSMLEGIVMGGGVGLSVHGHVRVATESTLFAMPETGIGFFPDVGATHVLPRLKGALGTYLGLTGARLSGRDVATAGIATHYVPYERLSMVEGVLVQLSEAALATGDLKESALQTAITSIGALDSGALGQLKDGIGDAAGTAAEVEPSFLDVHADEIDHCFMQPDVAAIQAAVDELAGAAIGSAVSKEAATANWAVRASRGLALASPTSLAVTLEALHRGAGLQSLGDCLSMEYRIAQRFLKHPDFVEGVGAVLRLSGEAKAPQWAASPSPDEVAAFFEPLEGGELVLE